jgi:hypothetical protein
VLLHQRQGGALARAERRQQPLDRRRIEHGISQRLG